MSGTPRSPGRSSAPTTDPPPGHTARLAQQPSCAAKSSASLEETALSAASNDARFRFGNGDGTTTRAAACQGLADFYGLIDGVSHRMLDHWENGPTTIV